MGNELVPLPRCGVDHPVSATRHHEVLPTRLDVSHHPRLMGNNAAAARVATFTGRGEGANDRQGSGKFEPRDEVAGTRGSTWTFLLYEIT